MSSILPSTPSSVPRKNEPENQIGKGSVKDRAKQFGPLQSVKNTKENANPNTGPTSRPTFNNTEDARKVTDPDILKKSKFTKDAPEVTQQVDQSLKSRNLPAALDKQQPPTTLPELPKRPPTRKERLVDVNPEDFGMEKPLMADPDYDSIKTKRSEDVIEIFTPPTMKEKITNVKNNLTSMVKNMIGSTPKPKPEPVADKPFKPLPRKPSLPPRLLPKEPEAPK